MLCRKGLGRAESQQLKGSKSRHKGHNRRRESRGEFRTERVKGKIAKTATSPRAADITASNSFNEGSRESSLLP